MVNRKTVLTTLVAVFAISIFGANNLQAEWCTVCDPEHEHCHVQEGPGFLRCTNIPGGCELSGACGVTKANLMLDGTIMVRAFEVRTPISPLDEQSVDPAQVTAGQIAGSQFVLGCDGRVVGRSYTVAAGERIRQSTAVLKI